MIKAANVEFMGWDKVGSAMVFFVAAIYLSRHLGSLPVLSRLTIAPPESPRAGLEDEPSQGTGPSGTQIRVGDVGVTETALHPAGKARFGKRFVDVIPDLQRMTHGPERQIDAVHVEMHAHHDRILPGGAAPGA